MKLWLTAGILLLASATAQAQSLDGLWKRLATETSGEAYYSLASADDGVTGTRLKAPEGLTFELALSVDGETVTGTQTVKEDGFDDMVLNWEFKLQDGKLVGRTEFMEFEDDGTETRGWENHTLEPLAPVGLVLEGEAPDAPSGDALDDLSSLGGGWVGLGGGWAAKADGDSLLLTPVGHHEGVSIKLSSADGLLSGEATLADGGTCQVELALSEGKLNGRSSWVAGADLGDDAVKGWAPVAFERLERAEAGPDGVSADAPAPTAEGELVGVWKRDDGLYLRLRKDGEGASGVLSDREGQVTCRLTFAMADGVWAGTANWGDYETKWELSLGDEGLSGRAEWVDVHEGTIVARGWSGRTFSKLRRIH